jgi:hypothetical protein
MHPITEAPLEAITIEEGQKELKIFLLPLCGVAVIKSKWRVRPETS